MRRLTFSFCWSLMLAAPALAEEFQFKDGDRVALVGSTLIEREQKYGYWELAITTRHPDKNIIFRNLGWSGDTVWGEARLGFDIDNPQKGFERLRDAVLAVKPTVIIVGYGTNESFAGEAGLPRFKEGLNKLLDAFGPTKARLVLLVPMKVGPDSVKKFNRESRDRDIEAYASAIRAVGKQRRATVVDVSPPSRVKKDSISDNGIHLNEFGYLYTAERLTQILFPQNPEPPPPRTLYKLAAKNEQLRQAIIEKNQLYFHRYRPQNETYLFGFRRHEQGNNAVEVAQFAALIEAKEKEIAKLRAPGKHTNELAPKR